MAELTPDQIAQVVQNSIFSSREWANAGREFAAGMKAGSGFSSGNATGVAGGRGGDREDIHRDATATLKTEIKLKKLANAQNEKTSKMLKRFSETINVIHPRMKTFRRDIALISNTLDTHINKINERFDSAADEIEFWEKKTSKAGRTIFDLDRKVQKLNRTLNDETSTLDERLEAEKELVEVEVERAQIVKKANPELRDALKHVGKILAGLATVGVIQASGQMMSDIQSQRKFGTPGGMFQQFGAAFVGGELEGIDPQLMNELVATNRAAVIAMGGTKDMGGIYARLGENINELVDITGDRPAALKFQLESYQTLVRSGIKPTEAAFKDQVDSLVFAQEAMGMTSDEFASMQKQLVTDQEFRRTLNGLDERQRRQRLKSINDQIATNRANGMMQEQAIAAAVALENLAGKGPRDRFKEMAKLQALGAMAGVKMSEDVRSAFIKGRSATAQEKTARQEFMSQMGNRLTEISATMGGSGTEIGIMSALEKAGFSLADFDNSLTNIGVQLKMEDGPKAFQEQFKRMVEQMGPYEKAINDLTKKLESLAGVVSNVAGGGILQGLGTAAAAFFGARGLGGVKGMLGGAAKGVGSLLSGAGAGISAGATGFAALGGGGVAGAATAAGGLGLAAGGGYLAGTALNNFAKLWGGRTISTTLLDLFTDDYDPNEDYKHLMGKKTADATDALVTPTETTAVAAVKSLTQQERQTEYLAILTEATLGMASNEQSRSRISSLQDSAQASLSS